MGFARLSTIKNKSFIDWRQRFSLGLAAILLGSLFFIDLRAQTPEAPAPSSPEFTTNSGESFEDPFASPDAPGDATQIPSNPAPSEGTPPPADFNSAPVAPAPSAAPVPTPPMAPSAPITPQAPPVAPPVAPPIQGPDFDFPDIEEPRGARTENLESVRLLRRGTPVGSWIFSPEFGAGIEVNERPNQLHFELEGGYRLFENFDLNGVLSYRFFDDRVLSLLVMPSYAFRLTNQRQDYRIDLRTALGIGWALQGVRGSDFQIGNFPVKASVAGLFYITPKLAFSLSTDLEAWLFSVDTDGKSQNLLSAKGGVPTQFIPSIGLRWEFQ